jgi:lipid-A-disaccharide synthase
MTMKIYIIAGEDSGDNIGSKLMLALKQTIPDCQFFGIGGRKMEAQGLNSLFAMEEISIFGFFEIIPHIRKIIALINLTVNSIIAIKPDIVITIDSRGFNYKVAKKIKGKISAKLVHYVAPTVWAYNEKRAEKFAKIYDHMIAILPFEPPYFEKYGLPCSFVGHPIIEDQKGNRALFRSKYDIEDSDNLLCICTGSRKSEINKLARIFFSAVKLLQTKIKDLVVVIPISQRFHKIIKNFIQEMNLNIRFVLIENNEEKYDAFAASDIALVKNGTVAYEVAWQNCPMVVAYKINPFSYLLLKLFIKIKFVNLINILNKKEIIPELIQTNCTPEKISQTLSDLYNNKKAIEKQIDSYKKTFTMLGVNEKETPSLKAASIIYRLLKF